MSRLLPQTNDVAAITKMNATTPRETVTR